MEKRATLDDRIYTAIRDKAEAWEVAELSAEETQEKLCDATTEAFDNIIPGERVDRFEYYKSHMYGFGQLVQDVHEGIMNAPIGSSDEKKIEQNAPQTVVSDELPDL